MPTQKFLEFLHYQSFFSQKGHIAQVKKMMFAQPELILLVMLKTVFRYPTEYGFSQWETKLQYIKNNAWVTVNNDFFVTSEATPQWFSRVTKSRVKIIAESPHEWQKFVIHSNECIILFLTHYFMSWTHKSAKNYHRALISPLLPRAAFSDRVLWRHNNWSVTSCEREILVLWRHICLLSLHAQVGAKAIFTSE